MSAHTPGPFKVVARRGGHSFGIFAASNMRPIAEVSVPASEHGNKERQAEYKANADLLASAPKLLNLARASLSWLTEYAGAITDGDFEGLDRLATELRDAIKEAGGDA